jgi:hypothetical protein
MDSKYRFKWSKISKELLILARRFRRIPHRLIWGIKLLFIARKCWVITYWDSTDDAYGNSLEFVQAEVFLHKRNAKRRVERLKSYNETCSFHSTWIEKNEIKEGKVWFEDWIKKA